MSALALEIQPLQPIDPPVPHGLQMVLAAVAGAPAPWLLLVTAYAASPARPRLLRAGRCRSERSAHLERGQEGFLRDLDLADLAHALLALLLLLQELALAGDVAAVALGQHVLAERLDRLAGDDPAADRGLDRHLELLPRDQLLELLADAAALGSRPLLRWTIIDRLVDPVAVDQDVELDQVALAVAVEHGSRSWHSRG